LVERTTGDVTNICKKLYRDNESVDLIPFGSSGGCFIVLRDQIPFNDQVEKFLRQLGGNLDRLTLAETTRDKQTVAESVVDYLNGILGELDVAIDDFTINTKGKTLENHANKIKELRNKVEGNALYLQKRAKEVMEGIEQADKKLKEQIFRIGKAKAEAPPVEKGESARPKIFGLSMTAFMRWCGANEFDIPTVQKVLTHFGLEAAWSTINAQLIGAKHGTRGEVPQLTDEQIEQVYEIIGS
jgi:hypothetical protein